MLKKMSSLEVAQTIKENYENMDTEQQEHFGGVINNGKPMNWMPDQGIEEFLEEDMALKQEEELDDKLGAKARRGGY